MQKNSILIKYAVGMDCKQASHIVKTAKQYESECTMIYHGKVGVMKSLLNLVSLLVPCGATCDVIVEGTDEAVCMSELMKTMQAHNLI
ncbi:MAG: HPr family phosphocarrier protein [Erysipelotrichaceae bacterium]|nr:HPr family phosphocarrier protein [Erysipelotrichaceae bacterium]